MRWRYLHDGLVSDLVGPAFGIGFTRRRWPSGLGWSFEERGEVVNDCVAKREQVVFRCETECADLPLHLTAHRVPQVFGHRRDLVTDTLALAGEMLSDL